MFVEHFAYYDAGSTQQMLAINTFTRTRSETFSHKQILILVKYSLVYQT